MITEKKTIKAIDEFLTHRQERELKDEIFHKYPYERHQWFLKLKELKGSKKDEINI